MIAFYFAAERDLGRIAPDAEIDALAPTLIGRLTCCSPTGKALRPRPRPYAKVVTTVIAGVVPDPQP